MPTKENPVHLTPYENIVIGNFLYALGLSPGTRAGDMAPVANISNTQQTPLDPILADVFVGFTGACRLLEFKRKGAARKKDIVKRAALSDVLDRHQALVAVSRHIHWFAEISQNAESGVELALCPYLNFTDGKTQRLSMGRYVQELSTAALHPSESEPNDSASLLPPSPAWACGFCRSGKK